MTHLPVFIIEFKNLILPKNTLHMVLPHANAGSEYNTLACLLIVCYNYFIFVTYEASKIDI